MSSLVASRKMQRKYRRRKRHDNLFLQSVLWVSAVSVLAYIYHKTDPSQHSTYYDMNKIREFTLDSPDFTNGVDLGDMPMSQFRFLATVSNSTVKTSDECAVGPKSQDTLDCEADEYCISEAYPRDWSTLEQLRSGGVMVHFLIMIYMFFGLAIVCDDYFESALEKICEALDLKEDVAGATFMAAGGSAPELFTSIMGVFVSNSDIGFGTIVGSAVFNVLFVISLCAFIVPNLKVTWWPLVRDCVSYCIGIIVLVVCVIDMEVYWYEALILLLFYAGYVTIMYYNEGLEEWTVLQLKSSVKSNKNKSPIRRYLHMVCSSTAFDIIIYSAIVANIVCVFYDTPTADSINTACSVLFIAEAIIKMYTYTFFGYWSDPLNSFDGVLVVLIIFEIAITSGADSMSGNLRAARLFRFFRALRSLRILKLYRMLHVEKRDASTQTEKGDAERSTFKRMATHDMHDEDGTEINISNRVTVSTREVSAGGGKVTPVHGSAERKESDRDRRQSKKGIEILNVTPTDEELEMMEKENEMRGAEKEEEEGDGGDDDDDDGPIDLWDMGDTPFEKFMWVIKFPLQAAMFITIPDVGRERFEGGHWFWLTFLMSIVWIALLAFVMVWMATVIGIVLEIPDPVMGLTLLAGGTSIPDALSSLAVARKGFGDMAVSSSIGSNVFDILIGLPVPWFIATGIFGRDYVTINSDGLNIMVLTLFVMVGLVIATIRGSGFVLTIKLAWMMLFLYCLFVAMSLLLEYCILLPCKCE